LSAGQPTQLSGLCVLLLPLAYVRLIPACGGLESGEIVYPVGQA